MHLSKDMNSASITAINAVATKGCPENLWFWPNVWPLRWHLESAAW
uniref:Uncharacterized protein n=1 Tax=Rhizophora mucronata TaxID=61149 RepID=A0A2P2NL70_RHIMU